MCARVVEVALQEDYSVASAEYLGEFRHDLESYISPDLAHGAVVTNRFELPPGDHTYVAFVDAASGTGSGDSYVLAIAHTENGIHVLDLLREWTPPFDPGVVTAEVSTILKDFGIKSALGDHHGGNWPEGLFKIHGIAYSPHAKPKSDIYREFLPLLTSGKVEFLDSPKMIKQLIGLERRIGRNGKDTISERPRAHDDLINAAAGAILQTSIDSRVVKSDLSGWVKHQDLLKPPDPVWSTY